MLKTVQIESAWETHLVEGFPFGVEKIAPRDWVVFRLWGGRRVYLRDAGFASKEKALTYLEYDVNTYKNSIITALEMN